MMRERPLDQGHAAAAGGPAKNTAAPVLAGACRNVFKPKGGEVGPKWTYAACATKNPRRTKQLFGGARVDRDFYDGVISCHLIYRL
jgi:hypothetical protein